MCRNHSYQPHLRFFLECFKKKGKVSGAGSSLTSDKQCFFPPTTEHFHRPTHMDSCTYHLSPINFIFNPPQCVKSQFNIYKRERDEEFFKNTDAQGTECKALSSSSLQSIKCSFEHLLFLLLVDGVSFHHHHHHHHHHHRYCPPAFS